MDTQEFAYFDAKLTDIMRHAGDTNVKLAALSERAATKEDVSSLKVSVAGLHSRVGEMEQTLSEVVAFQKSCPAISDMNYETRRKKEIAHNRKAIFTAMSAVVAFVSAVTALWQTLFSAPSAAFQSNPPPPVITPPQAPPTVKPTPPIPVP